jgi:hypothetical protein
LRRAEGGAKIFGEFRVKNHDFTPKNHIFSDCGGRRENCWAISCEILRFYAKKSDFFPILGGARRVPPPPPPLDPPLTSNFETTVRKSQNQLFSDMAIYVNSCPVFVVCLICSSRAILLKARHSTCHFLSLTDGYWWRCPGI